MAEHGDYITFEEKIETYKKFHRDSTDHNKNWLVNTVNECTRLIIAAREKNLIQRKL